MPQTEDPAASQARREFLKRFFHDLATPLSAVSLHLEGADRRVRRGADPTEALAVARAELGKAFDLFDRGRDFLLEEPGPPEALELDPLVARACAAHPGVRFSGQTGARVFGDRAALSGAVAALIVNAIEAAGADSVLVSVGRDAARVRVRVENPGRLNAENPDALFSPKAAADGKTWGLGLSRARIAAADAGGIVRLEEREGRVLAELELPEGAR